MKTLLILSVLMTASNSYAALDHMRNSAWASHTKGSGYIQDKDPTSQPTSKATGKVTVPTNNLQPVVGQKNLIGH